MLRALIALLCAGALAHAAAAAAAEPLTAAAPDPLTAAATGIDRAQARLAATAAAARRTADPIAAETLVGRTEAVAHEARQSVAALAALLGDARTAPPRRTAAMAQIARGGRVIAAADRLAATIRAEPADRLERTAAMRVASPLGGAFWTAAAAAVPRDLGRLARFMAVQADATWRGVSPGAAATALLGLVAAALLMFPVRLALRRTGQRFMIDRIPQSRLRRSAWALWIALLGAAIPWLAILLLSKAFGAAGMVSAPWRPFAAGIVRGVAVAAAVASVAGALLQRRQPSWRLLPVGDATADEVRPWTLLAAVAVFATVAVDELLAAAAVSAASRDAANLVETLLHSAVSVLLLLAISRARRRADALADRAGAADAHADRRDAADDGGMRRQLVAVAVGSTIGWLTVAATLVALAMGYVALALLASRMLVWLPLVGAALYLLWLVVDDLATEFVSGDSAVGRSLYHAFGIRPSVTDQAGVFLSALLRLLLLAVAAIAAFAPFGSNLGQLAGLARQFGEGITIGQFTIAPGAIVRGLAVFAVGLSLVRIAERWLSESYLPKTELDEGARNSIRTVARYVGFILAALWALAALGIGFERIALMLSALSVGIGFGLQAITQNFVSGLILLIERPVKIGDLVEVGGQKGDVKRISVRATEILTADRSTLIVPNSELITKTVRNLTHADAIGVVQLKFTVPLDADVEAVRTLVLTLFKDAKAVFDEPPPKAFIDSIDDGAVHFNCTGYCSSPRVAYATRSDVLFRLIMALRERGIAIGSSAAAPGAASAAPAPGSAGVVGEDE